MARMGLEHMVLPRGGRLSGTGARTMIFDARATRVEHNPHAEWRRASEDRDWRPGTWYEFDGIRPNLGGTASTAGNESGPRMLHNCAAYARSPAPGSTALDRICMSSPPERCSQKVEHASETAELCGH